MSLASILRNAGASLCSSYIVTGKIMNHLLRVLILVSGMNCLAVTLFGLSSFTMMLILVGVLLS